MNPAGWFAVALALGGLHPAAAQVPAPLVGNGGAVAEILARPLFDASRRPIAQAAAPAASVAPLVLPRLAGVVIDGNRRSAVFAAQGDERAVTVLEGGRFKEFQVESIAARQVTVVRRGVRHVLRLSFDSNAPQVQAVTSPAIPNFVAPPASDAKLPAFNGPPGLANMPRLNQAPPTTGPASFAPNALSGIPGLPVPAAPGRP